MLDLLLIRKKESKICKSCTLGFEKNEGQSCPCCNKGDKEEVCSDCREWERKGYRVSHKAIYRYNPKMKEYFSLYKFQGDYVLREVFANELKKVIKSDYQGYSIIVVPLSCQRQKERGFNQVTAILESAKIEYQDVLGKKNVERQSLKSKKERQATLNPFYIKEGSPVFKKVLIVDDIYTTGTTIWYIYSILQAHGSKDIKSLSLAR
ncbi:ComF family protein [Streptococcus didelphis]|uniref:ComF family protein n=1 Tax=Streptococcus didelphis TaxID=102886 RepID=A0ABY9LID9_9STRE|nr:ComF family protein [Streptococcus didelphis]WMB28593.1 ComF family protein [Streptococcus didelphis]WMB29268.1 ComF family protein [Streptococcus didelphis]